METYLYGKRVVLMLVPDIAFDELVVLAKTAPIWLIESPENMVAAEKLRESHDDEFAPMISIIPTRGNESRAAICERILDSLDQHHNEYSQPAPYAELLVYGVSLGDICLRPFLDLGFTQFTSSPSGFLARKGS